MAPSSSSLTPFGDRLRLLLSHRGEQGTQAWLSERSGIDRSLLSRLISNERPPTIDTLRALAPALELGIDELVAGTPAEARLADVGNHVRRSDYEEAVGKLIEFEARIREVEARGRSLEESLREERRTRRDAEEAARSARAELEERSRELRELRERYATQESELERCRTALQRVLAQFSALKTRVDELQTELGKASQSSKVSAVLAGVAAAAGVATLTLLGDDEPPKPARRTKRNAQPSKRKGNS